MPVKLSLSSRKHLPAYLVIHALRVIVKARHFAIRGLKMYAQGLLAAIGLYVFVKIMFRKWIIVNMDLCWNQNDLAIEENNHESDSIFLVNQNYVLELI